MLQYICMKGFYSLNCFLDLINSSWILLRTWKLLKIVTSGISWCYSTYRINEHGAAPEGALQKHIRVSVGYEGEFFSTLIMQYVTVINKCSSENKRMTSVCKRRTEEYLIVSLSWSHNQHKHESRGCGLGIKTTCAREAVSDLTQTAAIRNTRLVCTSQW